MENVDYFFKSLIESLKFLAAPFSVQVNTLPDFAVIEDELIIVFQNAFMHLPVIIENDLLTKKAIASIIRCYVFVSFSLSEEVLFTKDALENNKLWETARCLATDALVKIGIDNFDIDKRYI